MDKSIEAMKLALEALEAGDWYINQLEMIVYSVDDDGTHENRAKVQKAITAIKEALAQPERSGLNPLWIASHPDKLAQPEQEPVALVIDGVLVKYAFPKKYTGHLYTTPPQRKPLTDKQIQKIWDVASGAIPGWSRHIAYARAIEAAHGIKENT